MVLTFGVYTTDKATVMYRRFTPILEDLETSMQDQLGRSVELSIRIFKSYAGAMDALVGGRVDFVRFGPASYVLVKQKNPQVRLLAMETRNGGKTFPGYIVTRKGSKIRTLSELRGKSFAFGDQRSTIGRFLAQEALLDAGISAKALSKFDYLGRHDRVYRAVQLGDFDAGALKRSTFVKLNKTKSLRVIAELTNVTKPWIARARLPKDVFDALSRALIGLKKGAALKALKVDGLTRAVDKDYAPIRRSMTRSRAFDKQLSKPGR